jgi:hypothetical protein
MQYFTSSILYYYVVVRIEGGGRYLRRVDCFYKEIG